MFSKIYRLSIQLLFCFININLCYGVNKKILEAKKSLVQISFKSYISSSINGIGFKKSIGVIINKKSKIILTKNSYWAKDSLGIYEIFYSDGSYSEAKLIYADPWLDIKFIKAEKMPDFTKEIKINDKIPILNQKIYFLDNYDTNLNFLIGEGRISDTQSISDVLSYQIYTLSMKNQSSDNCYPILNKHGEMIAFKLSSGHTFAHAIPSSYINDIKKCFDNKLMPIKKHIGIITKKYSLAEAVKYRSFPKKIMNEYTIRFPKAKKEVIYVSKTLKGSPANKFLKEGDILWKVEGKRVSPNLYKFDKLLTDTKKHNVNIEIIRDNKFLNFDIELIDLNSTRINYILQMGEGLFFYADCMYSFLYDVEIGKLLFLYQYIGFGKNTFLDIIIDLYEIKKLNGTKILNMNKNQIEQNIINMTKSKAFFLEGRLLLNIQNLLNSNKYNKVVDLSFNEFCKLKKYKWDKKNKLWKSNDLY